MLPGIGCDIDVCHVLYYHRRADRLLFACALKLVMTVLQKDTSQNHTHLPTSILKDENETPNLKIEIIIDKNMNNDHRTMMIKSLYFL